MTSDRPLGAGLVAFGIAGVLVTLQIKVRTFNDDPGPQLFPMIGFAILILCGLGMLLIGKPGAKPERAPDHAARLLRGTVMAGLMVAFGLGLWLFGYVLTTPVIVYALWYVIAGKDQRTPWKGALYALGVTAGVYLLFGTFLGTLLPQGILF